MLMCFLWLFKWIFTNVLFQTKLFVVTKRFRFAEGRAEFISAAATQDPISMLGQILKAGATSNLAQWKRQTNELLEKAATKAANALMDKNMKEATAIFQELQNAIATLVKSNDLWWITTALSGLYKKLQP